ncbi:MAG TPA: ATP-dependent DNA ligase [Candidatus Woesebacteria bacterium]|nr:ATP-dependent DNA ligase [Candidatus Woesebacteria bacterium]
MKFTNFADYLARLEATSSRLAITEILAELFKKASADEVDKICYLSLGQLAPLYEGVEFNLAEKLLFRAVGQAFKVSEEEVKREYKKVGDLGEVAQRLKTLNSGKENRDLSVNQVYEMLLAIAEEGGSGSVERKVRKMAELLGFLDKLSVKYVVRIPLGRLRLGFSDLTILDALSWMLKGDKSQRNIIEEAFNVQADIGNIVRLVKVKGLDSLKDLRVRLGVPVMSGLCQRLPTADEMITKMGKVAVEPKYDGTRLQMHFSRKKIEKEKESLMLFDFKTEGFIRTFTRNLENTTPMFPDLAKAAWQEINAQEVILDGEAIGFDLKTGKFLPFQETIKRKRKHDVSLTAQKIPLRYYVFDVLFKDGRDLLKLPLSERRTILEKTISPKNRTILISPQIVTDQVDVLRTYHDEQKQKGLEGVVVKKWSAPYDPGRRGFTWVKFKEEESKKGGGLADTLECVVMGYYRGKGKRAGFGIGAFLVGIREAENSDTFLTISKIGTGLTDEQWRELKAKSENFKVKSEPKQYKVNKNLEPDVWCEPKIMVEIQADNITVSPIHTAGLALRFPRLVRFRDLKAASQATTLTEAKKLFRMQK